jgi:RNA polymerase sigma-70 factor (ECF subfamily)
MMPAALDGRFIKRRTRFVVSMPIVSREGQGTVVAIGRRATAAALRLRQDDELMELTRAGVLAAFEELVRRHHRPVRAFCARMLGDGAQADDAAQEVFLEVWRTSGRYQPQGRLRSYLLACARNRCLKVVRRREPAPPDEPPVAVSPDQLDSLLAAERRQRLTGVMQRLPPKLHEALALRFASGLEYHEIAQITGRGEETIRSRVFLGLKRLRALLGDRERSR